MRELPEQPDVHSYEGGGSQMSLRRLAVAAILLMGAVSFPVSAQGPTQERINFTISVPFELKKSSVVLPPGDYIL